MLAGTGRRSLLAAFMLITTLLSMFICNTATCAMMVREYFDENILDVVVII